MNFLRLRRLLTVREVARLARLLLLAGAMLSGTALAQSESDYQARLEQNNQRISKLKAEAEEARRERERLLAKVQETEKKLGDRSRRITGLKKEITQYEQRVSSLENQLADTSLQIQQRKQQLGKMIRSSLKIQANNGLQIMLQHQDPAVSSRLGVYYDHFFRAQKQALGEAVAQLAVIRDAHHEALKSRNWLRYLKKKASGQREQYAASRHAGEDSIRKLDKSLEQNQKNVKTLASEQAELTRLMEELRRNSLGASGFFEVGKGKYPWPVQGRLSARYGSTKSVGKLKWTGILIESATGNAVRAIADGEIVYADWLQGFGMLVIVDHGDGYMTLYGGNRALSVAAGDWVEHGSRIATVGSSVGQKQPGLYFEIRHNAKPVNPETWINSKNRFKSADNKG